MSNPELSRDPEIVVKSEEDLLHHEDEKPQVTVDVLPMESERELYATTFVKSVNSFQEAFQQQDLPAMEAAAVVIQELFDGLSRVFEQIGKLPNLTYGDRSKLLDQKCQSKLEFHKCMSQLKHAKESSSALAWQDPPVAQPVRSSVKLESLVIQPFEGDPLKISKFLEYF